MKGMSSFATFALTTAMIGLLIGLSLRSGNAQIGSSNPSPQTFLNPASLGHNDVAHVSIANVSNDPTSPAARFVTTFFNPDGAQLKAATCELRAQQSCFVPLDFSECGGAPGGGGCDFRAVVTVDPETTPPTADGGASVQPHTYTVGGDVQDRQGNFKGALGPVSALTIPTITTTTGSDGGVPF
jgi:hypothetical protein